MKFLKRSMPESIDITALDIGSVTEDKVYAALKSKALTLPDCVKAMQSMFQARRFKDVVGAAQGAERFAAFEPPVRTLHAKALAGLGRANEGYAFLDQMMTKAPNHSFYSTLAEYSAIHGFYTSFQPWVDWMLPQIRSGNVRNLYALLGTLKVLRQLKKLPPYFEIVRAQSEHFAKNFRFYEELSDALHSKAFQDEASREDLLYLTRLTAIQTLEAEQPQASTLLKRNSLLQGRNQNEYKMTTQRISKLFAQVYPDLPKSVNTVSAGLLFIPDVVKSRSDILDAINQMDLANLRFLFSHDVHRSGLLIEILETHAAELLDLKISAEFAFFTSKLEAAHPHPVFRHLIAQALQQFDKEAAHDSRILQLGLREGREGEPYDKIRAELDLFKRQAGAPEFHHIMKGRKPKIAVCISGQLRGYEAAWPTIKSGLFFDADIDVFLHVWEKIGRKEPMPAQANRVFDGEFLKAYRSVVNQIGYAAAKQVYKNLLNIDDLGRVTLAQLSEFYDTPEAQIIIEDDEATRFSAFTNMDKMYYKVSACHAFMKSFKRDYDLIVRLRPDKALQQRNPDFAWEALSAECERNTVFADFKMSINRNIGLVIGDQFCLSSPALMDVYANALADTVQAAKQGWYDWPASARAHTNFAHALWINATDVKTVPILWKGLLDPVKLSPSTVYEKLLKDVNGKTPTENDTLLVNALLHDIDPKAKYRPYAAPKRGL